MSQKIQVFENSKSVNTFVSGIQSKLTRQSYVWALKKYMKFVKVQDPDELIKAATRLDHTAAVGSSSSSYDASVRKYVESNLREWIVYMRNNEPNMSANSIRHHVHAVASFYIINDVVEMVNFKKLWRFLPENHRPVEDRAYTTEEIAKMLETADERMKVIILLMASAGLRIGALEALEGLKLYNLEPVEDFYRIVVYAGSNKKYETFCTPECRKAIDNYIDLRKRFGEQISKSSPVLRDQFDITKGGPKAAADPKALSRAGIKNAVWRYAYKVGLRQRQPIANQKGKRTEVYLNHGLRKFFNTQLNNAKVNPIRKEILMGHDVGLDNSYDRPTQQQLIEDYKAAIPLLTINQEARLSQKVKQMQDEKIAVGGKVAATASVIDDLRKQLEENKKQMEEKENRIATIEKYLHSITKDVFNLGPAAIKALEGQVENQEQAIALSNIADFIDIRKRVAEQTVVHTDST